MGAASMGQRARGFLTELLSQVCHAVQVTEYVNSVRPTYFFGTIELDSRCLGLG